MQSTLRIAPDILATEMGRDCCNYMFANCKKLVTDITHPYIAISNINKLSICGFNYMFYDCSLVGELTLNFTNTTTSTVNAKFNSWLSNVKSTGKFYTVSTCNWPSGISGIPTGWTRINTDE